MQFVKIENNKLTIYKNTEFPYKFTEQQLDDEVLTWNTNIGKDVVFFKPENSGCNLGDSINQLFDYSNDQFGMHGDLTVHYITRKRLTSLTDKDLNKIVKVLWKSKLPFVLEVVDENKKTK